MAYSPEITVDYTGKVWAASFHVRIVGVSRNPASFHLVYASQSIKNTPDYIDPYVTHMDQLKVQWTIRIYCQAYQVLCAQPAW